VNEIRRVRFVYPGGETGHLDLRISPGDYEPRDGSAIRPVVVVRFAVAALVFDLEQACELATWLLCAAKEGGDTGAAGMVEAMIDYGQKLKRAREAGQN
jgi:hypothetical protein